MVEDLDEESEDSEIGDLKTVMETVTRRLEAWGLELETLKTLIETLECGIEESEDWIKDFEESIGDWKT